MVWSVWLFFVTQIECFKFALCDMKPFRSISSPLPYVFWPSQSHLVPDSILYKAKLYTSYSVSLYNHPWNTIGSCEFQEFKYFPNVSYFNVSWRQYKYSVLHVTLVSLDRRQRLLWLCRTWVLCGGWRGEKSYILQKSWFGTETFWGSPYYRGYWCHPIRQVTNRLINSLKLYGPKLIYHFL